jgi:lupus La protein
MADVDAKPVAAEANQAAGVSSSEQPTISKPADSGKDVSPSEGGAATAAVPDAGKKSEAAPAAAVTDQKAAGKPSEQDESPKRKRDDRDGEARRPFQKPQYKKYRDNIKSRFELPESNDPDKIREQVEFYFSDSNIISDDFLFEQTGGSENKPVPIKTLHNFKRMRHFQPFSAVVEALKESKVLEVVNGDEVKRKKPIVLQPGMSRQENIKWFEDEASKRTLYAKGFGEETDTTQLDIEEFFRPYGPVNAVRLRRTHPEKVFKGSVWVEFETEELMQQFLALELHPKWQDEIDLKMMTKKTYCDGKVDDIKAGRIQPNRSGNYRDSDRGRGDRGRGRRDRDHGGNRGRGGRRGGRDRSRSPSRRDGDRDGNDWNRRRDDFQKGGYRDRGDRNGRRDGRRNGEKKEQPVDSQYVPYLKTDHHEHMD